MGTTSSWRSKAWDKVVVTCHEHASTHRLQIMICSLLYCFNLSYITLFKGRRRWNISMAKEWGGKEETKLVLANQMCCCDLNCQSCQHLSAISFCYPLLFQILPFLCSAKSAISILTSCCLLSERLAHDRKTTGLRQPNLSMLNYCMLDSLL